ADRPPDQLPLPDEPVVCGVRRLEYVVRAAQRRHECGGPEKDLRQLLPRELALCRHQRHLSLSCASPPGRPDTAVAAARVARTVLRVGGIIAKHPRYWTRSCCAKGAASPLDPIIPSAGGGMRHVRAAIVYVA